MSLSKFQKVQIAAGSAFALALSFGAGVAVASGTHDPLLDTASGHISQAKNAVKAARNKVDSKNGPQKDAWFNGHRVKARKLLNQANKEIRKAKRFSKCTKRKASRTKTLRQIKKACKHI